MRAISIFLLLIVFSNFLVASDLLIDFQQVQDLNSDEWEITIPEGEERTQGVRGGKRCEIKVKNWWKDRVRPPKGEKYILELKFRDTIKEPFQFYSFSGLGRYLQPTELHRFGGNNDSSWKTAQIPLSWDTIRLKKDDLHAIFYLKNNDETTLWLKELRIRKAKFPEDSLRYFKETRAWIKKTLDQKAFGNEPKRQEVPVEQKQKLIAYAWPYYQSLSYDYQPSEEDQKRPLSVSLSTNEYEPISIGLYATEKIDTIQVQVSDLKNEKQESFAGDVKVSFIEYSLLKKKNRKTKEWIYEYSPERLWPMDDLYLEKGSNGWVWLTFKSFEDKTKEGFYRGTVKIIGKGVEILMPLEVNVLPLKILSMKDTGLHMGGCITGLPSEQEMSTMVEYNHNMINLWVAGAFPRISKEDKGLQLEYYYYDEFMKTAKACGQEKVVWFLGGNPYGYPETLTLEREIHFHLLGGEKKDFFHKQITEENRGKVLPEIRASYVALVKDLITHAREQDWPQLILTPFDEPAKWVQNRRDEKYKTSIGTGPWIRDHFKDASAAIHEADPLAKVYVSMHHNYVRKMPDYEGRIGEIFIPDVDVVNTNAIEEDHQLGEKTKKQGKEFWQYSGYRGGRYNFGFYFGVFESTGSLAWAYNWGAPFNASGKKDDQYAYSTPFGVISTPEYEILREAWDDRRYLETYRRLCGNNEESKKFLAEFKQMVLGNLEYATEDKVDDFYVKEANQSKQDFLRKLLAKKIMELSKKGE